MKKLLLIMVMLLTQITVFSQLTGVANDCVDAIPICSNEAYNAGSTVNQGDDCDVNTTNRGCITGDPYPTGSAEEIFCRHEYSPAFLYFKIEQAGSLEFLAYNPGTDLDWMLYGPATGSDLGDYCDYMRSTAPVRCNFSTTPGQATGCTGTGAGQTREPAVPVLAEEVYILLIQQWGHPPSPLGFNLYFNGGSGGNQANTTATFDCSVLPVEFGEMYVRNIGTGVQIVWTTTVEQAIDHFSVLRWREGEEKIEIASVASSGTPSKYTMFDELESGSYMYQIKTVEQDGSSSLSRVLFANQENRVDSPRLLRVSNAMGQVFDPMNLPSNQVLFFVYDGGRVERVVFFQ